MSSLRYQVFHAIRIGCSSISTIRAELGISNMPGELTRRAVTNTVSKLRSDGMIAGGAGEYRVIVAAGAMEDDRRGKSAGSAKGRERGVMLARRGSPEYKPSPCLLAECWKDR